MSAERAPADRVRTLLLRGDNLLKRGDPALVDRALASFDEARSIAEDPSVDPRVRELVDRRLASARRLAEGHS